MTLDSAGSPACSITREFPAPPERVFEAWIDSSQLSRWWGPRGFTNPVCKLEPRPGGGIRIDMRGPDGAVYPMVGAVEEIEAPGKLVFSSAALDETGRSLFKVRTAVAIAASDGGSELSVQAWVLQKGGSATDGHLSGMKAGWTQSFERLDAMLAEDRANPEIVSTRRFPAPRAVVFGSFIDPRQLSQWWGPKGFTNTFKVFEPRTGGRWHFTMHGPDGANYPIEKEFVEVIPEEKIVLRHLDPVHGFRMTMTYEDEAGGTRLTWRMKFHSAAEAAKVSGFIASANEENFDRLEAHLAKSGAPTG